MANQNVYNPGGGIYSPPPDYGTAASINAFMNGQAKAPFLANLPQYQDLTNQSSENIFSGLKGQVAPDVVAFLQRQAAERGVASGFPGAPNVDASYLQALGLTSIGEQQRAETNLTGAVNRTPVPQIFNPASLYVPQTLGAQELGAARAGQASTQPRGGLSFGGGTPGGLAPRTATQPAPAPGNTPAYGGLTSGQFFGTSMLQGGQLATDDQIAKIAAGHFNDQWQIQDDPMAPMQTMDNEPPPQGSWYDPSQDVYQDSPTFDDYSSYFE